MEQEEKDLLMKDLCSRLPYGVKILYKGWDSDHGCEFFTDEDLIGIDDRFIYTLWRGERQKHSIVGLLSITDYKPYLRPMRSMTKEERDEYIRMLCKVGFTEFHKTADKILDFLYKNHFDFRGLIPKDLALEAPEGMYNN